MKVRLGFVSNSSSSSFVLVGYAMEDTEENQKKLFKQLMGRGMNEDDSFCDISNEKDIDVLHGEDDGVGDQIVFGKIIVSGDENNGLDCLEIEIEELENTIKKAVKDVGGFVEGKKPKIFTGTRMC